MATHLSVHIVTLSNVSNTSHSLPSWRSSGRLSLVAIRIMCYTGVMKRGKRTTRYSFYRGDDNLWHFRSATQYVGPSKDGINRVYNIASRTQWGGTNESYRRSSIQLVTNVPSEARSLLGKDYKKWQVQ